MTAGIVGTNTESLVAKAVYNYFKTSNTSDVFYAAVGFPDRTYYNYYAGVDSDATEFKGGSLVNAYDASDDRFYAQNTISMHKMYSGGVARVVARKDWTQSNTYNAWPASDSHVMVKQFTGGVSKINVYRCLFSPGTASKNTPFATTIEPAKLPDGYVWKFMYTISNSEAILFLTENWMPVPEAVTTEEINTLSPSTARYSQYLIQENAVYGTVYDVEGTLSTDGTYTVEDLSITPKQKCIIQVSSGKKILVQEGIGYAGPTEVYKSGSSTALSNVYGIVAPGNGHGSNIPDETFAKNIIFSARNAPEGDFLKIINGSKYNMVSLIKNPIDSSTGKYCAQDFYIACKSFSPSTGISINGEIIFNSKTIYTVAVDASNDVAYYIIPTANKEKAHTVNVGETVGTGAVTKTYEREVVFGSGQALIVDWKAEVVTRSSDQVETLNFILGFN